MKIMFTLHLMEQRHNMLAIFTAIIISEILTFFIIGKVFEGTVAHLSLICMMKGYQLRHRRCRLSSTDLSIHALTGSLLCTLCTRDVGVRKIPCMLTRLISYP